MAVNLTHLWLSEFFAASRNWLEPISIEDTRDKPRIEFLKAWLQCHKVIYVLSYPKFDPSCAGRVDAFRATHEPHRAELVPPHITLVFGVSDRHQRTLDTLIEKTARETREFTVVFNDDTREYDPFDRRYKIFLLCENGKDQVTTLHDRLYAGIDRAEINLQHPFRPHMTVATCDTRAEIDKIDVSRIGDLPITGKLHALELVRLNDGKLTTLKTAPFQRQI